VILTGFLVLVILNTATRIKITGPNAGIPVGGTVALCGLFSKPVSDVPMNPARSLGPALISGCLGNVWIYILGPLIGGLIAVLPVRLLHGPKSESEEEAARGEGE
jgi:aquaporin Z